MIAAKLTVYWRPVPTIFWLPLFKILPYLKLVGAGSPLCLHFRLISSPSVTTVSVTAVQLTLPLVSYTQSEAVLAAVFFKMTRVKVGVTVCAAHRSVGRVVTAIFTPTLCRHGSVVRIAVLPTETPYFTTQILYNVEVRPTNQVTLIT